MSVDSDSRHFSTKALRIRAIVGRGSEIKNRSLKNNMQYNSMFYAYSLYPRKREAPMMKERETCEVTS